jgi:RNA polymerase primary sigma factor
MGKPPNIYTGWGSNRPEDAHSLDVYFKQIGEFPLIDAAEEARLARRIKKGDKKALEKLTKANLKFVASVAKQFQNQGLSLADLINEGNIGLIKAAKRFDETRGFKFISYAVWWIRQAILQALAEQGRIVRLPLNRVAAVHKRNQVSSRLEQKHHRTPSPEEITKELGQTNNEAKATMGISNSHLSLDQPYGQEDGLLSDILKDENSPSPDEELLAASLREDLDHALSTLTAREAEVIKLYFGLDHSKSLTLEQIGQQFSLTRERVRQIKEKAIRRLRHVSRSRSLKKYLH